MERTNIAVLLADAQSSAGTAATLAAANHTVPVIDNVGEFTVESERQDRRLANGSYSRVKGHNTLRAARLRFSTELISADSPTDGTAGAAGILTDLFKACDMSEVLSPGVHVIFKPTVPTDEGTLLTLEWYSEKKKHQIFDAKGTWSLECVAGQIPRLNWEFLGRYVDPADSSFPTGMVYPADVPPVWNAAAVTYASYAPVLSRFTLNLGNQLAMRRDATAAGGYRSAVIVDRQITGGIDPESVAAATNPWFADWSSSANRTLTIPVGGTADNKFLVTATISPTSIAYGDKDGVRNHQFDFNVELATPGSTIGDELQVKFF